MKKWLDHRRSLRATSEPDAPAIDARKLRRCAALSCALALAIALFAIRVDTQSVLRGACGNAAEDVSGLMRAYEHSFCLFEKLLQLRIETAGDAGEIETYLKAQDASLLAIEGADYDGVYMYYDDQYLYSWSTPMAVYEARGYDATERPWYIGAVAAQGKLYFSTPYPSYANDYMLATISRLQPDGETVIAYDLKLGGIQKYVDRLNLYGDGLALICDQAGAIIGSSERLYLGGHYTRTDEALGADIEDAQRELEAATDDTRGKATEKLRSAEALQTFIHGEGALLKRLVQTPGMLRFDPARLSYGYAYGNENYTGFVFVPAVKLLPRFVVAWAAAFAMLLLLSVLVLRILGRSSQIITDALTGLNNRRALQRYGANHILHHPDDELCLIMLDLNDFKQINDRFGHLMGDDALLQAADALKEACNAAQQRFFLCRYGGDEFLLVGLNCTPEDIGGMQALIAQALQRKNATGHKPYVLEASIGVAQGICTDQNQLSALLARADKAMYDEKNRRA